MIKSIAPHLALFVLACASPSVFGWSLFERSEPDVVVVTDFTPAGKLLAPVSPEKPVYFTGLSLGNKLGSIPGDKEPEQKKMLLFVARLLAKQGFKGSPGAALPPSQFLVIQWGYMKNGGDNPLWFLGYNPKNDIAAPAIPGMLGPEVYLRNARSREVTTILDYAETDLYGIIITSFDHKTARTAKPVALWQTRISFPATGNYMERALPKMLTSAAGQIGRETSSPVLSEVNANAHVILGEAQVVEAGEEVGRTKDDSREKK